MTYLRRLMIAGSILVLAACATTTPYQKASKPGGYDGYTETMIENDRAKIAFGGNSLTERDTVENYLLYRSAELAVERGFDYFTLAERDTETNTRIQTAPRFGLYDPYFDYSFFRPRYGWSRFGRYSRFYGGPSRRGYDPFRNFSDPFFRDFDIREITKYRASAEVKFGRGARPDALNAFDAKDVLSNLGPTIIYPEQES